MLSPELFTNLPLLADGCPHWNLAPLRAAPAATVEALNVLRPRAVQHLHESFAASGARLLRTNTAQGQAAALAAHGLQERAEAINNTASNLARGALAAPAAGTGQSDEPTHSGGAVMGVLEVPPHTEVRNDRLPNALERALSEQAVYLSDTAVDLLLVRHARRLDQTLALVRLLKRVTDAPVLVPLCARFAEALPHTADGVALPEAGAALAAAGADALGLGCSTPLALAGDWAAALAAVGLPLALLAGTIGPWAGPATAAASPRAFAAALAPLAHQRGVLILGGCCGVTPAHIRTLARALGRVPPQHSATG